MDTSQEYKGFRRKATESDQSWAARMRVIDAHEKCGQLTATKAPNPYKVHRAMDENAILRPVAAPTKTKRAANHTQRTRKYFELQGGFYERTETFNHITGRRSDFLGIIDGIALLDGSTVGVQECSLGDVSTRRKKMLASPLLARWVKAGNRAIILAWKKDARGHWKPEEFEVTP